MAMTLDDAVAWLHDVLADYPTVVEIEGVNEHVPPFPFPQAVWVRSEAGADYLSTYWVVPLTDFVEPSEYEGRLLRAAYEHHIATTTTTPRYQGASVILDEVVRGEA